MIGSILVFAVILSVLVLIHELGHFLVAKFLKIKVEEFGMGFPPKVWGKKIGETVFSINLFPIGGFVRLHGEDEAGSGRIGGIKKKGLDVSRAYFARSATQRALVAIAGVIMNFLLAVVIFYVFMFMTGFRAEMPRLGEHKFYFANQSVERDVVVTQTVEDSPASEVEIMPGTVIERVNDVRIGDISSLQEAIESFAGERVILTLRRLGEQETFTVALTPRVDPPENEGAIGVALGEYESYIVTHDTVGQKVFSGFTYPINLMAYNVNIIADLIGESVEQGSVAPVGEGVSGPVGIFAVVDQAVRIPDLSERVIKTLELAGLLSISLAFFNILPIPALDGGRLFFIGIEKFLGRKLLMKIEPYAHAVGMVVLLGLLIVITIRDIDRFF